MGECRFGPLKSYGKIVEMTIKLIYFANDLLRKGERKRTPINPVVWLESRQCKGFVWFSGSPGKIDKGNESGAQGKKGVADRKVST